jgi:hypothetical protein
MGFIATLTLYSVIVLIVIWIHAEGRHAECHYDECRHSECRSAVWTSKVMSKVVPRANILKLILSVLYVFS